MGDFGGSRFLPQERASLVPPPHLISSQGSALKQTPHTLYLVLCLQPKALQSHPTFQIKAGGRPLQHRSPGGPFLGMRLPWQPHSASHLSERISGLPQHEPLISAWSALGAGFLTEFQGFLAG